MLKVGCRNCGNSKKVDEKCKLCSEDDFLPEMTKKEYVEHDLKEKEIILKSTIYEIKDSIELQKNHGDFVDDEYEDYINDLKIKSHFLKEEINEIKNYRLTGQ